MKLNSKVFILAIIVVALFSMNYKGTMTVAPSCFEKEMCKKAVPLNYCEVIYDCIEGKCWYEYKRCPEICYGNSDEDFDGLIDCEDPDCFNSPYCKCEDMGFTECKIGRCYCPPGKQPNWAITDELRWCECR